MKKFARLLAAVALTATPVAVVATVAAPPAQAASTCTLKNSYDEENVKISGQDRVFKVYTQVDYFHCLNPATANRWIEPNVSRIGYTVFKASDGSRVGLNCSTLGWLQEVRFDLYFGDRAGHAIIPGARSMPCSSDGAYETAIVHDRVNNPRLLNCGGGPSWKNDFVIAKRLATDQHASLAGTMWGFIGPFPVHPNCP